MDPVRKRKIRLLTTLGIALLLATALIYTSFSASTVARTPSQLLASATPGKSYELTGKVVDGSLVEKGNTMSFKVRDRAGSGQIPVVYKGTVPDPFKEGREVIVTGKVENGVLVGEPGSLITKCPSKFTNAKNS
ncbi:MAG TPA: cytochrome c maturation protein CcmE [Solirubrobacterales bacterium]|jgi:cytochrome c-type biogenesis protein CcmE|nr:cytochrome c maturation protein CcmE [Solirubrobacterales bacterium]